MSRWAVRRPVIALIVWFVLLVIIGGAAAAFGGKYNDSFELPGVESTTAQNLLTELSGPAPATSSVQVVWSPTRGKATDEATKKAIEPALKELAALSFVECVVGPYGENYGRTCPKAAPTDLRAVVMRTIAAELSKQTGIPEDKLREVADLINQLSPLQDADPAKLAAMAAALPQIAKLASAPKELLDALADIPPKALDFVVGISTADIREAVRTVKALDPLADLSDKDLDFLAGITKADVKDAIAAFGDLRTFADLPADVLTTLANTDPDELAAIAKALPGDITKATTALAEAQKKIDTLGKAAEATQVATSAISADGTVAYATATLQGANPSAQDATQFVDTAMKAKSGALTVGVSGPALESAGASADYSEIIGLGVAFLILLIAFGSLVAAGLPIAVALTGLVGGQLLIAFAARFLDVPSFAPTLAMMIGLGVGIDYSLFILNRFNQAVRDGKQPKDAVLEAVGTSGKAVIFAGSTVIVALLGMFVLRISFFNGLAVASAAAVLMVMLSAIWMLPALLSLLGSRSLALRLPWARHPTTVDPERSRWAGYGRLLQRKPIVPAVLALAVIGVLAFPALRIEMGFPDDSSQAQGSPLRTGFDLLSEGFGPGVNGPFFVAVQTPKAHDYKALHEVITALEKTEGVASTIPSARMLPLLEVDRQGFGGKGDDITSVIVRPKTQPSSEETTALLDRIRDDTAPAIEQSTGTKIYVGGTQAVSEDFTFVLTGALPVFLLLVVGLGFLALMLLFHSLLIPLTAAVTSLLSFFGALGVTVAVFQLGVADSLLGVSGTGPILPFLPIMVFAILFGLSMDYQVFLVTRMREEWNVTGDNKDAVRRGLSGSGRVVVVAATIMTSVFLSFVPTPSDTIKLFGVALASAVIIDAFIVRLVLVPSLMSLFGKANWWMPRWLGRILPTIKLE